MKKTMCVLKKAPYLMSHMLSPHFLEVLMSSPRFQGLMAYERMIGKMLCAICNMLCAICKMLCVVYNMYDDAC